MNFKNQTMNFEMKIRCIPLCKQKSFNRMIMLLKNHLNHFLIFLITNNLDLSSLHVHYMIFTQLFTLNSSLPKIVTIKPLNLTIAKRKFQPQFTTFLKFHFQIHHSHLTILMWLIFQMMVYMLIFLFTLKILKMS